MVRVPGAFRTQPHNVQGARGEIAWPAVTFPHVTGGARGVAEAAAVLTSKPQSHPHPDLQLQRLTGNPHTALFIALPATGAGHARHLVC